MTKHLHWIRNGQLVCDDDHTTTATKPTTKLQVWIPGHPTPQGSMVAFPGAHGRPQLKATNEKQLRAWRTTIAHHTQARIQATNWQTTNQPVTVTLEFHYTRPQSHYGTGRNAATLKPNAPTHPTTRSTGDADKLARAALDALTAPDTRTTPAEAKRRAHAWHDDAQVIHLTTTKQYANTRGEGLQLTITLNTTTTT